MILKTERLLLRPTVRDDAAALFAILGNAEAMRFWHRPVLPRLGTVEALLADELLAMAAGGFHYWTVLRDGDAIGSIDLSHADEAGAWTGFLFRRDQWGQGYAREAMAAVIAAAFGPLGLAQLMARVRADNARAVRLLEQQGFQKASGWDDSSAARDWAARDWARYDLSRSASQNGV